MMQNTNSSMDGILIFYTFFDQDRHIILLKQVIKRTSLIGMNITKV
jgi:hypothetical protein